MTSLPRTPLLASRKPLADSHDEDSTHNGQSHGDMRQELQQLRHMIKFDMKELLDAEFGKGHKPSGRDQECGSHQQLLRGSSSSSSMPLPFSRLQCEVLSPNSQPGSHPSTPPGSPPALLSASDKIAKLGDNGTVVLQDGPTQRWREPDSETRLIHNSEGSDEDSDAEARPRRGKSCEARPTVKRLKAITHKIKLERTKFGDSDLSWVRELNPGSAAWGRFVERLEWFWLLEEPKREGCLASFVGSKAFEGFFTLIILLNSIFIAFQVNTSIEAPASETSAEIELADRIFLALYLFELVGKLCVHKLHFFWCPEMHWNILDFALVAYSLTEAVIGAIEGSAKDGATWLRSLRFFRMAKVLRVLRVVKSFKQLQIIINSLLGSLGSMIWSVVMLVIFFYMFSLALCTQVRTFLVDSAEDDVEQILMHYGSVQIAIWTLFKATFGGEDWVVYYEPLVKLGIWARLVWYIFIVLTQVSLLNILTGLYVEGALEYAEGNAQDKALRHEAQAKEDAMELRKLCETADWDKSNTLSKDEFLRMLSTERFSRYMQFVGLDTAHMHMFFDLISERGEQIDIPSFVAGVMHLRGGAKSSDLIALMLDVKGLKRMQDNSTREVLDRLGHLQESLERVDTGSMAGAAMN